MNVTKKGIYYILFFPILIIYFEIVIKITLFNSLFNEGFLNMVLFSIPIGLLMYLLSTTFNERENKICFILFTVLLTIIYGSQFVYYNIFSTFLSMYSFIGTSQAMQFWKEIVRAIMKEVIPFLFLLLPLILITIFHKKLNQIFKTDKKLKLKIIGVGVIIQIVIFCIVQNSNDGDLSPHYLYSDSFIIDMSVERFGLLTTERLDCKNIINSFIEKNNEYYGVNNGDVYALGNVTTSSAIADEDIKQELEQEIKYNVMNIDFDTLLKNEKDEEMKDMNEYFSKVEPTNKNEYTGKFKGKNLILITAEGFSPYVVNKNLTPTLYKMYKEGFKFTDFYTPLWGVSTSDGEYVACTGLLPKAGIWSFYRSSENYMPFCMGNQMKAIGYQTFAYHDHYYDYYKRNLSHPNMGYTYKGLGNGLDVRETWPESDLEMIDLTAPEYINERPFHTYYMTVSGHLRYTFEGNYMSYKNKDAVGELNYSDNVKAYLACNIELDKAMESLIKKLEEAGIAEDTLIAISPDHYPYGLELPEISELAGHDVEENFELYKSIFILWSKGMEPVTIEKPCSSLDIIPTLSNLMGIEYDSRLLMGRDIMSNTEPLVMFSNRSWITDKATYNSTTEELKIKNNSSVDADYEEKLSKIVKDKFKYSALILDKNYYAYLFN